MLTVRIVSFDRRSSWRRTGTCRPLVAWTSISWRHLTRRDGITGQSCTTCWTSASRCVDVRGRGGGGGGNVMAGPCHICDVVPRVDGA